MNPSILSNEMLKKISERFLIEGQYTDGAPYGDGHINTTFKISTSTESGAKHYILQRINQNVFKTPDLLMDNINAVTKYLNALTDQIKDNSYEVLNIIPTIHHHTHWYDDENNPWRMYKFVENAIGHTFTNDLEILEASGAAFGMFQVLLSHFPAETLHETIPNFHNTPHRFSQLEEAISINIANRISTCSSEISFANENAFIAPLITDKIISGQLPLRVTHNDTKLNNVLIDTETKKGRCVIDLDTVMPGSLLYDFGDSVRSSSSTAAEDEVDLTKVSLDLKRFRAFSKGFIHQLRSSFTPLELELLPFAGPLMTLECGVRFLTDYLNGDVYFKTIYPEHNLVRAKNQFQLFKDMMNHMNEIKGVIYSIYSGVK